MSNHSLQCDVVHIITVSEAVNNYVPETIMELQNGKYEKKKKIGIIKLSGIKY